MQTVKGGVKKTKIEKREIEQTIEVPGVKSIHGVSWDGKAVWFADGSRGGLTAVDPETHKEVRRLPDVPADAGTAFDGKHLWQVGGREIKKIDPQSGAVVATIPAPDEDVSGLAWGEGALWAGGYRGRTIRKLDPETGKVLKTITSDRLVTGVTWVDGELWHGTVEGGRNDTDSNLRQVDPETGDVLVELQLPKGVGVSGVEAGGRDRFWCGDPFEGKLRAVRR